MSNPTRIIIADDHPIVRQGVRQAIERDPQLQVVAEANNGREALEYIQKLQPQIALLDVDMPEMHGFDVAREVQAQGLPVTIIFLTVHREEDFFNEALALGAKGYVLKEHQHAAEAMAARGITLGCGGGDYCPAENVTRGQSAVFLVRAFGL